MVKYITRDISKYHSVGGIFMRQIKANQIKMLDNIKPHLSPFEKVLLYIFRKYSLDVFKIGVRYGYFWN